ncbi:F-box protein SKIP23-like [Solanum stenotomum]|uniref:F-box protein SKIP23-like n=1 Tax=Solanum stenotomum TaxID=172797 RepID=UPI0020D119EB|nr:F-box protein SKIP23-like [Solanum stenotomum]
MGPWCDLPIELVERISKFVNSHIDILRIRAVCSSWRSAFSPNFKTPKSQFPIKLPITSHCYLIECTVYVFQLPHPPHTGWLVKILKTLDGTFMILNPLTNRGIKFVSDANRLNLLDFRVSQVCKSYHAKLLLEGDLNCHPYAGWGIFKKILPICNDQTTHFSIMAINVRDHLLCFKSGDDDWTTLKDLTRSKIVDISVYKGNFYAVDTYGETIMYDPFSFNKTNVSSTVKILSSSLFNEWGSKKRLVESDGELFLVDMFLDTDVKTELQGSGPSRNNPMEIKIYRLDEEQHQWIRVHTLGDRIFFAGDDCCFSVSSSDFGDQCRGNCIYYKNGDIIVDISGNDLSEEVKLRYKGLHDQHTGIITLQDGKLGSLSSFLEYADIFWPPPSWLFTDDQASSKKFSPQMLCFLFDTRHVSSCQDEKKLDTRYVRSF